MMQGSDRPTDLRNPGRTPQDSHGGVLAQVLEVINKALSVLTPSLPRQVIHV